MELKKSFKFEKHSKSRMDSAADWSKKLKNIDFLVLITGVITQ